MTQAKRRDAILAIPMLVLVSACATMNLEMPDEPMYIGSYATVPIRFSAGFPPAMDTIDFVIDGGPPAGEVSLSRDSTYDPSSPEIMLLAGHQPGTYRLRAISKVSGDILAEGPFQVIAEWRNKETGPSLWFSGVLPKARGVPGAAWGGGPPDSPQNLDIHSALGTRKVNIVLVDTDESRYPTDPDEVDAIRKHWTDEAVANGSSAANYYKEVSQGKFGLDVSVHGPVNLPGSWDDYFESVKHPGGGDVWRPRGEFYQACAAAADSLIVFSSDQSVACVSKSIDDKQYAWPYAGPTVVTTAEGTKILGGISMPADWETLTSRKVHHVLSHELGHNLGLPDLYTPEVFMFNPPTQARNVGGWDLMDSDGTLPHFSIAHRMMLGWVDKGWIETSNFQVDMPPVDKTVVLHPSEAGAPPGTRKSAVEVRIADGWNYYFEYRKAQSSHIGDKSLPQDNRVLGTDVVSWPYSPPTARPAIELFDNDPDVDGSVLNNGQNYREVDATDPMFPTDFAVDASGINGSSANVRVRYGVVSKPDPYIRPWPAAKDRQWESPDIEVKNARNQADPAWKNAPWREHANTIVATVHNGGSLAANGVAVQFFVKDSNLGHVPSTTLLGSAVNDIPPLKSVEFSTMWTPPAVGNYCIMVQIVAYTTAGGVAEISGANNIAQTNYERFISATASPPSREIALVEVGNPYALPTRVFILPSQTNAFYRTYLGHRWLQLDPGESRKVPIMFEYAPDAAFKGSVDPNPEQKRLPNNVEFVSFIEDPRADPQHGPEIFAGIQVQVVTGRATRVDELAVHGNRVRGTVATTDDGTRVPGGKAIVTTRDAHSVEHNEIVAVTEGSFNAPLRDEWKSMSAYYIPLQGYGDSNSRWIDQ